MKLSIKGLALAVGILWGAVMLLLGLAHLIWPDYGTGLLQVAASIYPGYTVGGFGSVIVGTLYAALDGAIGGAAFAWLYNRFAA
jgi:hypothetical protein